MNNLSHQITSLDDPPKFLFFTMGQVMAFSFFFMMGMLSGYLFTLSFLGLIAGYFVGKNTTRFCRGFMLHCLYWFAPGLQGLRVCPESSKREFLR